MVPLKKAADTSNFKGSFGQMVEVLAPTGVAASRILLVGLGDMEKVTPLLSERLGGKIINKLIYSNEKKVTIV